MAPNAKTQTYRLFQSMVDTAMDGNKDDLYKMYHQLTGYKQDMFLEWLNISQTERTAYTVCWSILKRDITSRNSDVIMRS